MRHALSSSDTLPNRSSGFGFFKFVTFLCFALLAVTARADNATDVWQQFRAAHRFHSDLVGVSGPDAAGERILIIAEPPERFTIRELRSIVGPRAKSVRTMTHMVMHDGTVTDLVITLAPPFSEADLQELSRALHAALTGTASHARLIQLPASAPNLSRPSLDLRVSSAELFQYLIGAATLLQGTTLQAPMPLKTLLATNSQGVYATQGDSGLMLWLLPRNGNISGLSDQLRDFAVSGDILLGSISNGPTVALIARKRVVPLARLPALRNDTVQLLAAVNASEVSQSYERTMWPSGRSKDSYDHAPIYLSSVLRDTEYGSLLNIVDQLLKGWSEAGQIAYKDFNYPAPSSWPFGKSRASSTVPDGEGDFLFNWNTRGLFYSQLMEGYEVTALSRTGALPVIYGSTVKRRLTTEAKGWEWFATIGDANIARVVQYATLFSVFKRYGITSDWLKEQNQERDGTTMLLTKLSGGAVRFLLAERASPQAWSKWRSGFAQSPEMSSLLDTAEISLDSIAAKTGGTREQAITLYADLLGDPRNARLPILEMLRKLQDSKLRSPAQLKVAEEKFVALQGADAIAKLLSRSQFGAYIADQVNLWDAMAQVAERQSRGWIQTAAVVMSKDIANVKAVGGHSIDSAMTALKQDATLAPGQIALRSEAGGEVTVLFSPADKGRTFALSRRISELQGRPTSELKAALSQTLSETPGTIRPIREALALNAGGPTASDFRLAVETTDVKPVLVTAEGGFGGLQGPTIFVRRLTDHYEVSSTESGTKLMVESSAALHQVILDHARSGSLQAGRARIVLAGFDGKTDALVQSVKSRVARSARGVNDEDALFISVDGMSDSTAAEMLGAKRAWGTARIDSASITTRKITAGPMAGHVEMSIPLEIPQTMGRPGLLMRIFLYFKDGISDAVQSLAIARVKAFLTRPETAQLTLADFKRQLVKALKSDGVNVRDAAIQSEAGDLRVARLTRDEELITTTHASS